MAAESQTTGVRSLLDEIEELQVLEAGELQEGVAFHAFRFKESPVQDAMVLTLTSNAAAFADKLVLPQGATLTDVQGNKMRILFDSEAIKPAALKASVTQALGKSLGEVRYSKNDKVALIELPGTKLA